MSSLHKRMARIKAVVKIDELLYDYGYKVHPDSGDREQQFSCDMHGTGRDNKPSARVYPSTGQWYCFACDKSRDAVATVAAKERMTAGQALLFLEQKYNLPFIAAEEGEDEETPQNVVAAVLDAKRSLEDDLKRLASLLKSVTVDRMVSMDVVLAYWEALDKIAFQVRNKTLNEATAQVASQKLYDKLLQTMRGDLAA